MRFWNKLFGIAPRAGVHPCDQVARSPTRKEVEDYVEREMRGIPQGWKCVRPEAERLWWLIKKASIAQGEWSDRDYSLHISDDLHWFIVTYDNNDIGAGSLPQEFQKARVISASSLERYALSDCIHFVLKHCKPNEWGYT